MKIPPYIKRIGLQIFALAVVLCALSLGHKALAIVVLPDGGGDYGLGSEAPAQSSARYHTGSNDVRNFGQGNQVTPYYDVGNNAADYTYSSMKIKAYINKVWGGNVYITIDNAASDCHSASSSDGVTGPDYSTVGSAIKTNFTIEGANGYTFSQSASTGGCDKALGFSVPVNKAFDITPTSSYDGFFYVEANVPGQTNHQN